jgi:alkyldihydroxyacetonephosphate synthase
MAGMHGSVVRDLGRMLGEDAVSREERDRLVYSRDMWPRNLILLRSGVDRVYAPDVVVWPGSVDEVAAVTRYASRRGLPVIPFGGGSGVCGGTTPRGGGIVLDLKRLSRVGRINETDRTVDVEAGTNGQHFEDALNARGYTAGHFPASIWCSTVGGWMATRGAGQCSSLYGKVEDMVSRVRFVMPDGGVVEAGGFPRRPPGPGWIQALVGSEGTLGVITDATMRVHRLPERRTVRAFGFPGLRQGIEFMRETMTMGLRPAVMRLYDPIDTLIARSSHGPGDGRWIPPRLSRAIRRAMERGMHLALLGPGAINAIVDRVGAAMSGGVLMILVFEGRGSIPDEELSMAMSTMLEHQGQDLGTGPALAWLRRRYAVSFWQSKVFSGGAFSDTFEVSATWDRLLPLYQRVLGALGRRALVMAHLSHAYLQGCSIYFSFAGRARDDEAMLRLYDALWQDGLRAAQAAGGVISHHHGIGMSKVGAMAAELGGALEVFEALKNACDPRGVMNPGKLSPD